MISSTSSCAVSKREEAGAQQPYSVSYIHCKVCGSDAPKVLGLRGNLEYSGAPPLKASEPHMVTNVVACRNCGFVYTNPLMLLPEGDHRQQYHESDAYVPYGRDPAKALGRVLASIEQLMPRKGRLLDVGAGKGEFLAMARNRGWKVEGVEPSEGLANHATETYHLPLTRTPLGVEGANFPDESFDVVTLNMVLEHVEDPNRLLREINRVLTRDGLLLIEVPALDSFLLQAIRVYFFLKKKDWSPLLSPLHWPFHCYGYPLRTIRYLCRQHGFRVVKARTVDLSARGFRAHSNISPAEARLRYLVMKLGGLMGRGDVLMVYCRKSSEAAR